MGITNGLMCHEFRLDVLMKMDNIVAIGLEVEVEEVVFVCIGCRNCDDKSVINDLFVNHWAIVVMVIQTEHELPHDLIVDTLFDALKEHIGINLRATSKIYATG